VGAGSEALNAFSLHSSPLSHLITTAARSSSTPPPTSSRPESSRQRWRVGTTGSLRARAPTVRWKRELMRDPPPTTPDLLCLLSLSLSPISRPRPPSLDTHPAQAPSLPRTPPPRPKPAGLPGRARPPPPPLPPRRRCHNTAPACRPGGGRGMMRPRPPPRAPPAAAATPRRAGLADASSWTRPPASEAEKPGPRPAARRARPFRPTQTWQPRWHPSSPPPPPAAAG